MTNLFDLSGQTAVISGGSKGLGYEMATALAEAGANVVLGARTEVELKQAAADLAAATGVTTAGYVVDVTQPPSVSAFFTKIMDQFERIDVVVNSAGINIRQPITEIPDENWRKLQKNVA